MEKIPFLSVKINLGSTLSKQPTFFFSSESYNRPEKDGSIHSRFLRLNPYSNFIFLIPYIEWWCETLWYYMVKHYALFVRSVENEPKQFIFNLSLLHIDSVKHYAWLVWLASFQPPLLRCPISMHSPPASTPCDNTLKSNNQYLSLL